MKKEELQKKLDNTEKRLRESQEQRDADMIEMTEMVAKLEEGQGSSSMDVSVRGQRSQNKLPKEGKQSTFIFKRAPRYQEHEVKNMFKELMQNTTIGNNPREHCREAHNALNEFGSEYMKPYINKDGMCGKCGEKPGNIRGIHFDGSKCEYDDHDCQVCEGLMVGLPKDTNTGCRPFRWHNEKVCGWTKLGDFLKYVYGNKPKAKSGWLREQLQNSLNDCAK